jgi:hypothetical protein
MKRMYRRFFSPWAACSLAALRMPTPSSLMCMSGKVQGNTTGDGCDEPIQEFMSIISTPHGHFDYSATPSARRQFLNQCSGSAQNTSAVDAIISQFGVAH